MPVHTVDARERSDLAPVLARLAETLEHAASPAYTVSDGGSRVADEGVRDGALVGGYTHLNFASNPRVAERVVEACRTFADGCI